MTKEAAIYNFWSSFDIPAYEENTIPSDATFPYIAYQLVIDSFGYDVMATASLWYRDESWLNVNSKANEIAAYIGQGGKIIKCDGGRIWIKRNEPFAQNMGDPSDDLIRRKYLNIAIEFLTTD